MYFDEYVTKLAGPKLPAFILFLGDAEDVQSECQRLLRQAFQRLHATGSVQVYDGGEQDLSDLLNAAQASSLFASDQLLLMRRGEKRLGGRQSDGALETLSSYLEDPNPLTVVALTARGMKKDSRIAKLAAAKGWMVQCGELPAWKAVAWVRNQAREIGLQLSEEAAQVLLQKVGTSMGLLRGTLEHLGVFLHPSREIRAIDVEGLPVPGAEPEFFAFVDAVGERRYEDALCWLSEAERSDTGSEEGILFMLYGRLKELLQICACRDQGLSQPEAASAIPMHPFRLKTLWEQARLYEAEELERSLREVICLQAGQMTGRFTKTTALRALETRLIQWAGESRSGGRRRVAKS